MTAAELARVLDEMPTDAHVYLRVQVDPSADEALDIGEADGEYFPVADARSVQLEYGRVVIVGDWE